MELIGKMLVQRFVRRRPQARAPMAAWVLVVERAGWRSPHDVRETLAHADFLGGGLTIFNVGGNKYRISTTTNYRDQRVVIRRVMTHREYDRRSTEGTL